MILYVNWSLLFLYQQIKLDDEETSYFQDRLLPVIIGLLRTVSSYRFVKPNMFSTIYFFFISLGWSLFLFVIDEYL